MPDLDEGVIRLEERSDAHTRTMEHLRREMSDLRHSVDGLRSEMHALRAEMRDDLAGFRADVRHDFADLRASMDRRFMWLTGIQVAGLVAVIGALVGTYYR